MHAIIFVNQKAIIMRTILLFIFTFFICASLLAQRKKGKTENLVVNPSFEELASSNNAIYLYDGIDKAFAWDVPNQSTPKLYTTDGKYIYDQFGSDWNFKARSGKNVAGLGVIDYPRSYIQGTLAKPLEVGKKYDFSFWVHYHCSGANNIGIVFLPEKVNIESEDLLPLQPMTFQEKMTPYDTKNTWTQVTGSFVARKPYSNFIIGNFFEADETELESTIYGHYFAYIDDIIVEESKNQPEIAAEPNKVEENVWEQNIATIATIEQEIKSQQESEIEETTPVAETAEEPEELLEVSVEPEVVEEVTPEPASKPVLPQDFSIQFRANSTVPMLEPQAAVDAFVAQILASKTMKVLVEGHASSEGAADFNMKLSERRAQAVVDYLKKKGIPEDRISIQAFGETQPVAANDTEENRSKNRRVVIKPVEN